MDRAALTERIADCYDQLPGQLGRAARYIVDHPGDVALLSMREQARRAGVQPWTMTRLAKRLGFGGYDAIRELHGEALKEEALGFAGKADVQFARHRNEGSRKMALDILETGAAQLSALAQPANLESLEAVAEVLADARHIFCFGLRSSHAVVAHFAYVASFLGNCATQVEADLAALVRAGPGDVFFAISVAPYTRATVEAARQARELGLTVVAVTDSAVSPLARFAEKLVIVPTESPSFIHAMGPAFCVVETLSALIAGIKGDAALEAITETERRLAAMKLHILDPQDRISPTGTPS